MSQDQHALLQQMLATNTKLLERYQRENNTEKIAEWTQKVDKLRAQLGQPPLNGSGQQVQQPGSYGAQPSYNPPAVNYQPGAGAYGSHQSPSQPVSQYSQPPPTSSYQQVYNPNVAPPSQAYTQPTQPYQQAPSDFTQSREYLAKEMEMQEMKLTNARLREQLAAKEDAYNQDARTHQAQANELQAKIQELLLASTNVDGALAEKAARIEALGRENAEVERRSVETLTEATLKSGQALRAKELEVEDKSNLVYLATDQVNQLSAQLQAQQETTLAQIRSLNDDKSRLQEALEHARNNDKQKAEQLAALQQELEQAQKELEDETKQVGVFVSKSMNAIKYAEENAKAQGSKGTLVVASESTLGFGSLSIKTVLNK